MLPYRGVAGAILCLAGLFVPPAFAAAHPAEPPPDKPYGRKQLGYDARYLLRRPFELEPRGRATLWAVGGSTVALYLLRDEVRDAVLRNRSDGRTRVTDGARDVFGKAALAPALALISWSASFATKNPREKETAFLLLESASCSAAVAGIGSVVLGAERPADGDAVRFLDTQGHGVSLDAALAASIVEPLRRQYLKVRLEDSPARRFWKRSGSVVLYAGASLTALARMDADAHWAPDAFLGVVTGLSIGRTLGRAHDEAAALRLGLVPGGAGFNLSFDLGPRGRHRHDPVSP